MPLTPHADALECVFRQYHHRERVGYDPLTFLYAYPAPADREIVAFVAGALAYGHVRQILRSVRAALEPLGPHPQRFLADTTRRNLHATYAGFRHRFATGDHLAGLLWGMRSAIRRAGTMENVFADALQDGPATGELLARAVRDIRTRASVDPGHLLADPARGSACKRLHLTLRWLVRQDEVDPGGWSRLHPRQLVVPLDTHMHRIGRTLGAIRRCAADGRSAEQLTEAFRRICPEDPVRYDFSLTRLGICPEADLVGWLARCVG